ncbi:MAG: hypothetical protein O9296_05535 [Novosphingobium sp.]|nr:hypothetical protein [Novosphingobium sp.]
MPAIALAALVVSVIVMAIGLATDAGRRIANRLPSLPRIRLPGFPSLTWKPIAWTGDVLAMSLANVLLLIVLGCLVIGMEVAFYAALVATPIWLVVLMFVALDGTVPDRSIDLPADHDHQPG